MAKARSKSNSRKRAGESRPGGPRQMKGRGGKASASLSRRFFRFLISPVVRRFILIVIVVGLLYWWGGVIWKAMLTLFGAGLAILAIALGVAVWVVWRGRWATVARRWNWFLGGCILALGVWGILSFFAPGEGTLSQATLGGRFGRSIIGISVIIGCLRVAGLIVLGIVFVAPRKSWRALRNGWRLLTGILRPRPRVTPRIPRELRGEVEIAPPAPGMASGVGEMETKPIAIPSSPVGYESQVREPQRGPILTPGGWQLPPIDVLDKAAEVELDKEDIEKRAEVIEKALASYGVEGKVVQINVGPTVTQFGVEPGWDRKYKEIREKGETRLEEVSRTRVRVDRITSLANDLALALAAPSIRIEAPVPGKSVVGIEVPNTVFGSVTLRSVIETAAFQKVKARSKLAIALGKGAGGEVVAADLAKMPHLLIAGATGSGKTVCLNSTICCLLVHDSPDDVQFIMVDPKRVELVAFNGIPHLAAPVIVESDKAIKALRWLNQEMDNRYRTFAQAGVRNIEGYNKDRSPADSLAYLVLVIDELADLMMAAFDEVEHALCRLAQLARATGIHLIVATQRPSVDVVTGLIKSNFPTRISFAVSSQVDSRTILDAVGAEKLLGRGDMLYMPTEAGRPKRLQGTLVSDAEVERLVYFWGNQRQVTSFINFDEVAGLVPLSSKVAPPSDPLLEEARRLAAEHKQVSTSFLQRRLRIGYPRAARLMETLEQEGLVAARPKQD